MERMGYADTAGFITQEELRIQPVLASVGIRSNYIQLFPTEFASF